MEKIGDAPAAVLDINADGATARWLVDPKTGLILRSAFTTSGQQGPIHREIDYSDYRPAEGLTLPFKRVTKDDGKPAASTEVKEVKINPVIDPKTFTKPTQ
jgi:hypothetical protein